MENEKVNILLVDDQPAKLLSYETILESLNENLIKVGSAREALVQLLKSDIAVVLLDACMPEMDGFELAQMIRKHPRCKKTSIILVSAIYLSEFDQLRGYDSGAVDYVPVPIVPEVLRAKVSIFADLYRKSRELQRLNNELEWRVCERTAALEASTARLKESDERYRAFVANSTEGVGRLEFSPPLDLSLSIEAQMESFVSQGRIAECNDALARMFGWATAEELTGAALNDVMSLDNPEHASFIRSLVRAQYNLADSDLHQSLPDGRRIWLAGSAVGVIESGSLMRIWGTLRDVTAQKHAEQERLRLLDSERVARAAAEQANRLKDDFLSTLSHELRTPMNAVLGWVTLMRKHRDDADTLNEGMDVIERGIRTQSRLIDDLLDVSRITSGKLRINEAPVNLNGVLKAAIDTVIQLAQEKGVSISTIGQVDVIVQGDSTRLQQVFWNLLSNAVKFTPRGGWIEVQCETLGGYAQITVRDSGQGIRPEFLPNVFDRFRQADSSVGRRFGGLGLGLAIVKNIVEMHHGAIRATSDGENCGASFMVRLPIRSPAALGPPEPAPLREPPQLVGVRVLVVDDDRDTRDLVSRTLIECGAEPLTVDGAEPAFRAIRDWRPHVMVCDLGMPNKDGYELMREIRASPHGRRVAAIALSAYTRPQDQSRALESGFDLHLGKPIDLNDLLLAIANRADRQVPDQTCDGALDKS